jgi:hypothetical protein
MIAQNTWKVIVEDKTYTVHAMTGHVAAQKAHQLYINESIKHDPDASHLKTVDGHKIYIGGNPDRETHIYHVKDKAGKTHTASLEHAGEAVSHAHVKKQLPKHLHGAVSKAIHNDHKDEMSMYEETKPLIEMDHKCGCKDPDCKGKCGNEGCKCDMKEEVEPTEEDLLETIKGHLLEAAQAEEIELDEETLDKLSKQTLSSYKTKEEVEENKDES